MFAAYVLISTRCSLLIVDEFFAWRCDGSDCDCSYEWEGKIEEDSELILVSYFRFNILGDDIVHVNNLISSHNSQLRPKTSKSAQQWSMVIYAS